MDARVRTTPSPTPEALRIVKRLLGTTMSSDNEAIIAYLREQAPQHNDIASFHAHFIAHQFMSEGAAADAAATYLEKIREEDPLATIEQSGLLAKHALPYLKRVPAEVWRDDRPRERCMLDLRNASSLEVDEQDPTGTPRLQVTVPARAAVLTSTIDIHGQAQMARPDARFVELVLSIPGAETTGPQRATRIRERSRQEWKLLRLARLRRRQGIASDVDYSAYWWLWLNLENPFQPTWLNVLLDVLWRDVVRPRLAREQEARPFSIQCVQDRHGDSHAKLPKYAAGVSWAFGGYGVEYKVEVDGDEYRRAPGIAVRTLIPKTYALLPADHARKPHQTSLPLDIHEETALPITITNATYYDGFSTVAGKLALLFFANGTIRQGNLVPLTLLELAKQTHPNVKRIKRPQLEAAGLGLRGLRGVGLYLPNGKNVQIFDIEIPWSEEALRSPDLQYFVGLQKTFLNTLNDTRIEGVGNAYGGEFLMNMTGAMRLPNNKPALLRYITRATAHWNAAFNPISKRFDENKLRAYEPQEWAIQNNSLAPDAIEYLRSNRKRGSRNVLSNDLRTVRDYLDELVEDHKLIKLKPVGSKAYKILPPDSWKYAWEQCRKGAARPHG
jgi:hypothetical protein